MPIEFHCDTCGRLMRTPDSTAGKKGKCPQCASIMDIPLRSAELRPIATAEDQPAADKIEFPCPLCGLPVKTPVSAAGKKGRCPSCAAVVQIPDLTPVAIPETTRGNKQATADAKLRRPTSPSAATSAVGQGPAGQPATIEFACPQCGRSVRTPIAAAGKKGQCPGCRAVFAIPAEDAVRAPAKPSPAENAPRRERFRSGPARRPKQTPGLAPLPDRPAGSPPIVDGTPGPTLLPDDSPELKPLAKTVPGLTPLADAGTGLTPLPGDTGPTPLRKSVPGLTPLSDAGSGLTPLASAQGLTPLTDGRSEALPSPSEMGLTPIADDPLDLPAARTRSAAGSAPARSPFADPVAAPSARSIGANPYQSPSLASTGYVTRRKNTSTPQAVVLAPAIAMIVVASLSLLSLLSYLGFQGLALLRRATLAGGSMRPEDWGFAVGFGLALVVWTTAHILSIVGGVKMLKFQSWGLALTGAILLILPCTMCWIGLPIGVWAVVVLSLGSVRSQFR